MVVLFATALAESKKPLERIRENIADCDWTPINEKLRVTLTIGAIEYIPGETATSLVRRADLALYLGKESGRDQIVLNRTPLELAAV